ncbi:tyrosine-type recombinase/integrase [bacterium]|nr:tyrosine-type recombinase/integrase [bacterium]MBU1653180.1 tyrosine-type recombinase/integrase [bacterium]
MAVGLFKRKSKKGWVYHLSYRISGRHTTESTKTGDKSLALEIARKKEVEIARIEHGLDPVELIRPVLLSEFIIIYLEYRRKEGMSPKTVEMDSLALRMLTDYLGDCSVQTITDVAVRQYKAHRLEKVSKTSVSIEFRSLRAALNWATEKPGEKYHRSNPFKQKGLIPVPGGRKIPKCLSPVEKTRFLAVIDNPDHQLLFKFFLLTGCRRGEAVNLKWEDIDLEQKQLTFRQSKCDRDRTLPVGLELMQIIMVLDRSKPKPFNYQPKSITRQFKRYLMKAGLRGDLHLHNLRHTAASDLVRQGVHLTKIQKFLGHSSVKVTEIYTHVLPEDLREVSEALTCVG